MTRYSGHRPRSRGRPCFAGGRCLAAGNCFAAGGVGLEIAARDEEVELFRTEEAVLHEQPVDEIEDLWSASVVRIEAVLAEVRRLLAPAEHVDVRPPEPVDALPLVADHEESVRAQPLEDGALKLVGVLELVD